MKYKNSHIGHCTRTAGSADVTVQNTFHGQNNNTFNKNCKYRTAATLHANPINMIYFRYITINTLHKGDKDNNNNNNNSVSPP